MADQNEQDHNKAEDFARQANVKQQGLVSEFWAFLKANKAWWLAPIIVVLVLLGVLLTLGGSGLAPFIYALF